MKEIKSCPFCGGEGELMDSGDWGTAWVSCKVCEAEGSFVHKSDGLTDDDAIDRWNMRA